MKNKLTKLLVLLALAIALIIAITSCSLFRPRPQLKFESNGDGTCTVVGVTNQDSINYLTIPLNSPDGDTVTSISDNAFAHCEPLVSVQLPDSITTIGEYAFYGCTSLEYVNLPNSVTTIGVNAFSECASLSSVTFGAEITGIAIDLVFQGSTSLQAIYVSALNTSYSDNAGVLYNKEGTTLLRYPKGRKDTSFAIPLGVTRIENHAFSNCASLENVVLSDSVDYIDCAAFNNCTSLKKIIFGKGVRYLHPISVFSGCTSLTSFSVAEGNPYYTSIDGNLYNKDATALYYYAVGKTDTSFIIPDGIIKIADKAFENCTSIESIKIPDSVTTIGDFAFNGCTSLKSIAIPNGVTLINDYTFQSCTSLTSIVIPKSITMVGNAFNASNNALADIYYTGSEGEWAALLSNSSCTELLSATIHYNYIPEN